MFHPPVYSSPKTTHSSSSHSKQHKPSPSSSPKSKYSCSPNHLKKKQELQKLEIEIDEIFKVSQNDDKSGSSSPYFASRLKSPPSFIPPALAVPIQSVEPERKQAGPKKPPRRKQKQQQLEGGDDGSPDVAQLRFKPYDMSTSESHVDGVFSSFVSLSITDKLSDLESSLDGGLIMKKRIVVSEQTPETPPEVETESTETSETTNGGTLGLLSTSPIKISELEYSMEPRNFSRPHVSSPVHRIIEVVEEEEEKEEELLVNGHCDTTLPHNESAVSDTRKDFTSTGKYDKLLPCIEENDKDMSTSETGEPSTISEYPVKRKKASSPQRRLSEDVSGYIVAQKRRGGSSFERRGSSSERKELHYSPKRGKLKSASGPANSGLKQQIASPPASYSGIEDSVNWQFISPKDYPVGRGVPLEKAKRKSSILSFLGEKSSGIFNPKKVSSVLKLLNKENIDPYTTNENGDTVLHCYVQADRPDKLDILLAYLVHCNCKRLDIDGLDRQRNTPLHLATMQNDIWSVKALLCFGADINSCNRIQQTPLDIVTEHVQRPDSNQFDELHELYSQLHAIPGGWDSPLKPHLFDESLNSLVNESYEIEEQVQLGTYLDERRLAAFVFKLEELISQQQLEFSVNTGISLPPGLHDANGTFFDPLIARQSQLCRITEWKSTLEFKRGAGSRMLFLDGGGIRGLIQIELLAYIESITGRSITELFDWIIGTSTGGIIALALVYLGMSLGEIRQLYFQLCEDVFTGGVLSISRRTEALEHMLKHQFKNKRLSDVDYPKVLITAVSTKFNPPVLHFFNNCFDNKFSDELVWKVARYTSAGPTYFSECEGYVDGGVLANNPCMAAWVEITNYHEAMGLPLPKVAMAVSIGTGIYPSESVGETDFFGKGWLDIRGTFKRAHRFIKMLATALVESEYVAQNFATTCTALETKFFRFSPSLQTTVKPDETDIKVLLDMIIHTKVYLHTQSCKQEMDKMVRFFRHLAEVSRGLNLNK